MPCTYLIDIEIKHPTLPQVLRIQADDFNEYPSPREWGNLSIWVTRENPRNSYPMEMDFNWDAFDEGIRAEINDILMRYYVFFMDAYSHGATTFSLNGKGVQCKFDTSTNCGFIAVPKRYNLYDAKEISLTKYKSDQYEYNLVDVTYDEAINIARSDIKHYNQWMNDTSYSYSIEKVIPLTRPDGTLSDLYERDVIDSCGGFYEPADIYSNLPLEWEEEFKNHFDI